MGGILKNKDDVEGVAIAENTKEFREQVLKNTKLNAQLKNEHLDEPAITPTDEKLQWNKQNLSENEIIQKNIIENLSQTIDEPKTPFQKATQPELNEYYQDDDDEEVKELDDFSLGEPEFPIEELDQMDNLNNSQITTGKKKSFEELRKQHYHNEHYPVVHPSINKVENDADDEYEDEPKKSFAELRKQHYKNEVPHHTLKFDDE